MAEIKEIKEIKEIGEIKERTEKMQQLINLSKFNKMCKNNIKTNDSNYADYINKNLDKLEYDDKLSLYKKLFTSKTIDKELMEYELNNLIPKQTADFNEFIKMAEHYLSRYTKKAGGFLLEDTEWITHLKGSKKYDLLDNEVIFDNSIQRVDYNMETINFVNNIVKLLSKINPNMKINAKTIDEPKEGIIWVRIFATKA